jgi:hypothetical protein
MISVLKFLWILIWMICFKLAGVSQYPPVLEENENNFRLERLIIHERDNWEWRQLIVLYQRAMHQLVKRKLVWTMIHTWFD